MITFEVNDLGLVKVKASFKGEVSPSHRSNDNPYWHYKFQICVESQHGKFYFVFHDSYQNYSRGKRTLDTEGICTAVDALLSDVYLYINDEVSDIWSDDDKMAEIVEKDCRRKYNALQRIVGDSSIDEFNDAFVKFADNN
jgi:hypothetical protein